MALDWITGFWHEATLTSITDGNQIIFQLVDSADLADADLYVERVIGQYYYSVSSSGGDDPHGVDEVYTHTRLCVRPEDQTTGAVFNMSIAASANSEEKFMWHKVHRWPYVGGGGPGTVGQTMTNFGGGILGQGGVAAPVLSPPLFVHPEWSHVDIRVGRKLEENDRLCWIVNHQGPNAPGVPISELRIGLWLRVLVKGR